MHYKFNLPPKVITPLVTNLKKPEEKKEKGNFLAKIRPLLWVALIATLALGYFTLETFESLHDLYSSLLSNFHLRSKARGKISILLSFSTLGTAMLCMWWATFRNGQKRILGVMGILLYCSLLVYSDKLSENKTFAKGAEPEEFCGGVLSTDEQTVEWLGAGKDEGRTCRPVTLDEVETAKAVREKRIPSQINITSLADLSKLTSRHQNGAQALYASKKLDANGIPYLFNGPGFDSRSSQLDVLSKVNEEQLESFKAKYKEKEDADTKKRRDETFENERALQAKVDKIISDDKAKKKELEREESEKKAANLRAEAERKAATAKEESERAANQKIREEKIAEAFRTRTGMSLAGKDFYLIPYGLMVVMSDNARFKVNGVRQDVVDQEFFRKNNGKVIAECDSVISCQNSRVIMQKMVD